MNTRNRFFATFFVALFVMLAVLLAAPSTVYAPLEGEYPEFASESIPADMAEPADIFFSVYGGDSD